MALGDMCHWVARGGAARAFAVSPGVGNETGHDREQPQVSVVGFINYHHQHQSTASR